MEAEEVGCVAEGAKVERGGGGIDEEAEGLKAGWEADGEDRGGVLGEAEEAAGGELAGSALVVVVVCDRRWVINSSLELNRRPQKSRPCIQEQV